MNIFRKTVIASFIAILILGWIALSLRSDSAAEEGAVSLKTQKGLRFQVPEDWPIEERNGVVAPIPIEEYIDLKFKDVASQLDVVKKDLLAKFEKLESDLEVAKQEVSDKVDALEDKVISGSEDSQELSADLDKLTANLNSLEASLEVLSEDSRLSKVNTDNIAQQLRSLESRIDQLEKDIEYIKYNVAPEGDESWY